MDRKPATLRYAIFFGIGLALGAVVAYIVVKFF